MVISIQSLPLLNMNSWLSFYLYEMNLEIILLLEITYGRITRREWKLKISWVFYLNDRNFVIIVSMGWNIFEEIYFRKIRLKKVDFSRFWSRISLEFY